MFDLLFFMRNTPRWLRSALAALLFFPSVWVGVMLGDTLFIISRYGLGAYRDGLRFASSKHGILTDGTVLPGYIDIPRALFDTFLVFLFLALALWTANYIIGLLRQGRRLD